MLWLLVQCGVPSSLGNLHGRHDWAPGFLFCSWYALAMWAGQLPLVARHLCWCAPSLLMVWPALPGFLVVFVQRLCAAPALAPLWPLWRL